MAITKPALIASSFLLLCLFALALVQSVPANALTSDTPAGGIPVVSKPIDCGASCAVRCSLSSRPKLCKRACGTCCGRCQCVPSGTSGNYEACSCYANMTTRDNKHKCP